MTGKKCFSSNLILWGSQILILISMILVIDNMQLKNEFQESIRGFYSRDSVSLAADQISTEELWSVLNDDKWQDGILYKVDLDLESDTRGVWYKGKIRKPPLREGRFFDKQELQSNKKVALVGEKFKKDIFIEEGKSKIEILGKEFEVIGILGGRQTTRLDEMKWIPLDTAISLMGADGEYRLDGKNKDTVQHNMFLLLGIMEKGRTVYENLQTSGMIDGTHGWSNLDISIKIYLTIIFSFLLTLMLSIGYWCTGKRKTIHIMNMLGLSIRAITLYIVRQYIKIYCMAIAVSLLAVLILNSLGLRKVLYNAAAVGIVMVMIAGGCILAFCLAVEINKGKELL